MKKLLLLLPCLLMTACTPTPEALYRSGDELDAAAKHKRVARTFEEFVASPGYRTSRDIWRGRAIEQYNPAASRVEILLEEQRGRLYINGQIAMDFPICSGRFGGHETPKGSFRISQKAKDYRSNLYGSFVDAQGDVVQYGVTSSQAAPAGTRFLGASMPYWMRFNGAIGLHVGNVYRESDSHGCVRVPEEACSILFGKLAVGSKVIVR